MSSVEELIEYYTMYETQWTKHANVCNDFADCLDQWMEHEDSLKSVCRRLQRPNLKEETVDALQSKREELVRQISSLEAILGEKRDLYRPSQVLQDQAKNGLIDMMNAYLRANPNIATSVLFTPTQARLLKYMYELTPFNGSWCAGPGLTLRQRRHLRIATTGLPNQKVFYVCVYIYTFLLLFPPPFT